MLHIYYFLSYSIHNTYLYVAVCYIFIILFLIDRFIILALREGIKPVLIITKTDLADKTELKTIKEQETFIGKTVRYLPVYNINKESANGIPVKAFVFVNYSELKEFVFEEVSKKQAIQMLLKETWVNPTQKSVSCFFEWIENTAFYNLQYSKTEEA